MTTTTHSMLDYDTASKVGRGDLQLARESAGATGENGVVSAYRGVDGLLHYVPESRTAEFERMGKQVFSVYLDPAVPAKEVL